MVEIYALIDPITGHVKYIGKAKLAKKRYSQHMTRSRSNNNSKTYCYDWIRSLTKKSLKPELLVLDKVEESEWKFWEQHYISLYKSFGYKLTNLNNGGDDISKDTIKKIKENRRINRELGISLPVKGKNIQVINIETGEVTEYISLAECARQLNLVSTRIQECLNDGYRRSKYKGYIFKELGVDTKLIIYKLTFQNHKVFLGYSKESSLDSTIKKTISYSKEVKNTLGKYIKDNPDYTVEVFEDTTEENKDSRLFELAEEYLFNGFTLLNDVINNYRKISQWRIINQFDSEGKYLKSYSCIPRIIEDTKINKPNLCEHINAGRYNTVGGFKFLYN